MANYWEPLPSTLDMSSISDQLEQIAYEDDQLEQIAFQDDQSEQIAFQAGKTIQIKIEKVKEEKDSKSFDDDFVPRSPLKTPESFQRTGPAYPHQPSSSYLGVRQASRGQPAVSPAFANSVQNSVAESSSKPASSYNLNPKNNQSRDCSGNTRAVQSQDIWVQPPVASSGNTRAVQSQDIWVQPPVKSSEFNEDLEDLNMILKKLQSEDDQQSYSTDCSSSPVSMLSFHPSPSAPPLPSSIQDTPRPRLSSPISGPSQPSPVHATPFGASALESQLNDNYGSEQNKTNGQKLIKKFLENKNEKVVTPPLVIPDYRNPPSLTGTAHPYGDTTLMQAVRCAQEDQVVVCLDYFARKYAHNAINEKNRGNETALSIAVNTQNIKIIEQLVKFGEADPTVPLAMGNNVLHVAIDNLSLNFNLKPAYDTLMALITYLYPKSSSSRETKMRFVSLVKQRNIFGATSLDLLAIKIVLCRNASSPNLSILLSLQKGLMETVEKVERMLH